MPQFESRMLHRSESLECTQSYPTRRQKGNTDASRMSDAKRQDAFLCGAMLVGSQCLWTLELKLNLRLKLKLKLN